MKTLPQQPRDLHQPTTFRRRGVAIPVTTPFLAGGRVRAASPSGIEVVVPNPSGSQGLYIIPLSGLLSFCAPTVHDAGLLQYLTSIGSITPDSVRQVALRVAKEGYAGHEAAAVAEQTMARDEAMQRKTHFRLLAGLVEQVQPVGGAGSALVDLEHQAEAVLRRLANALGVLPARLAEGIQALSEVFAPVGFAPDDSEARLQRLLDRLENTCLEFSEWIEADRAHDVSGLGQAMQEPLRFGCAICANVLRSAQAHVESPRRLLRQWLLQPEETLELALRPAWVMDGWDQFCLVWMSAAFDEARRSLLLELPQYLPVLPSEVADWTEMPIPPHATEQSCRVVSREDGWRTGAAAFALIERNERLRAWSL